METANISNGKYYDTSIEQECIVVIKDTHVEIVYPNMNNFRKYTNKTYIQTHLVPMEELDDIADTLFED
jgi:hypothetical protein